MGKTFCRKVFTTIKPVIPIVSMSEMVFKGLLVIFAITTLGNVPSTKKGTRTNKSIANTTPIKNDFQNTFIMANFTRVLRRQPAWRFYNVYC